VGRERIQVRVLGAGGEDLPVFTVSDGRVKLSAAWLIERAGIRRGFIHGNVGTSTKHALAIVNRGGAAIRFDVPYVSLLEIALPTYEPETCPLCAQGRPVVKPGSRAVTA